MGVATSSARSWHQTRRRAVSERVATHATEQRAVRPEWYVAEYDDVRQMRVSAWNHWKRHGLAERRNPNGLFDTSWYIERNPEAAEDPLDHYLTTGATAGKDPSPRFSTTWYLRQNGDVAAAGMNPL